MKESKVHIYYGDGKGKTTAATGLAVRMLGAGKKVVFCQFLKDGASSEIKALKKFPDCKVMFYGEPLKFIQMMNKTELQKCKIVENQLFANACKAECDLLVLDEILDMIDYDIIPEELLLYEIDNRGDTEIVITGRNPSSKLCRRADYITFMRNEKHPFDKGEVAREGIEF